MKKIGKFSLEKVALSSGEIKVLDFLYKVERNAAQEEISKETGLTIGAVSKILNKLDSKGIIYRLKDSINFYKLVPELKKDVEVMVTGYDFGKSQDRIIDAHCYVFIAQTNELPDVFIKKLKENEDWIEFLPKNWVGYKFHYLDGSVKFHKTNNGCSVIFYFRTFAPDPCIADLINTEKFLQKKRLMEEKYPGLKIGHADLASKCPMEHVAVLAHPLALKAVLLGIKHRCIEDSHRIGGEFEEKGSNSIEKIRKFLEMYDMWAREFDGNRSL